MSTTLDKVKSGALEIIYERWDETTECRYVTLRAPKSYPSVEAMKAAVELEIMAALGRVQTVAIGEMIQKAIDAAAGEGLKL